MNNHSNPKWWLLYFGVTMILALFWKETQMRVSRIDHIVLEVGLLYVLYRMLMIWIEANFRY